MTGSNVIAAGRQERVRPDDDHAGVKLRRTAQRTFAPGETHARTVIKALTWRAGGFLMTVAVAWLVTHRAGVAASIGLADTLVKILAYYAHERLWLRVQFGRVRTAEYEI